MRQVPTLLAAAVFAAAAPAAAQDGTQPFITASPSVAVIRHPGVDRSIDVGFDATIGGPSVHRFQTFGTLGAGPGIGRANPQWYGTAGVRHVWPSVWRFRPYADVSAGVARMRFDGRAPLTPMAGFGAGVHLPIGPLFTVDIGYRVHRFLGDADRTRAYPALGFGLTF